MRSVLVVVALLAACAFPPSAGPSRDDEDCDSPCAGQCLNGRCVASPRGGLCDPEGAGPACVAGSECVDERCVASTSCAGVLCAGRCAGGHCIGAEPGEQCDALGAGRACRVGSCTDGRCPEPTRREPVPLAEVAVRVRDAGCTWSERCGFRSRTLADDCRQMPHTFDSFPENVELVQRGEATYDAELAATCISELEFTGCLSAAPESCDRFFEGLGGTGEHCTASASCRPTHWCKPGDGSGLSCIGTCSPSAREGEGCATMPCAPGLFCGFELLGDGSWAERCRVRTPPGEEGASCNGAFGVCAPGFFCNFGSSSCRAVGEEGDACDSSLGCADGLVCSPTLGVCLPLAARGEPCMVDAQCGSPLASVIVEWCDNGICAALPSSGECLSVADRSELCDPQSAWCDEGQCVPLSTEGGRCISDGSCAGDGRCSFETCAEPFDCP